MTDEFYLTSYFVVIGILSVFGMHRYLVVMLYYWHRNQVPRPGREFAPDELPRITLQLPAFNEMYVMERLLDAVCELDYPRDRLQVQVLDDSTDETVNIAARKVVECQQRGLDIEHIHRGDRVGFKAGALDAALPRATGELISILDADFVPPPSFLMDQVHYFTDPKVAVVQTRWGHLNRSSSLLTELQSIFLDGHLVLEQTARNRSGRYFNFNGTGGTWRKAAIEDAGGWEHDTLTEDIDLSYRAQVKGWRFVFLKDVVTPAELPPDIHAFKSQQSRWTKGMIQVARKITGTLMFAPGIPFKCRLEGVTHLLMGLTYPLMIILVLLIYPVVQIRFDVGLKELLMVDLPLFLAASVSVFLFYLISQLEAYGRAGWRRMIYLPMLVSLGVGMTVSNTKAWLGGLLGFDSPFVRTPKFGNDGGAGGWKLMRYKGAKNTLVALLEIGLGAYCVLPLFAAVEAGRWLVLPFLLLFCVGFFYVGLGSLPIGWPRRGTAAKEPAVEQAAELHGPEAAKPAVEPIASAPAPTPAQAVE